MTIRHATSLAALAKPRGGSVRKFDGVLLPLGRAAANLGRGLPCQQPAANPDWWFPTSPGHAEQAKRLCVTACPQVSACLQWALDQREPEGIWGGLDPRERSKLIRHRRSA